MRSFLIRPRYVKGGFMSGKIKTTESFQRLPLAHRETTTTVAYSKLSSRLVVRRANDVAA
ncbi:MAG: hypothetical protein ACKESB_00195 [Candidatus Hodgkinia cicadicola]